MNATTLNNYNESLSKLNECSAAKDYQLAESYARSVAYFARLLLIESELTKIKSLPHISPITTQLKEIK